MLPGNIVRLPIGEIRPLAEALYAEWENLQMEVRTVMRASPSGCEATLNDKLKYSALRTTVLHAEYAKEQERLNKMRLILFGVFDDRFPIPVSYGHSLLKIQLELAFTDRLWYQVWHNQAKILKPSDAIAQLLTFLDTLLRIDVHKSYATTKPQDPTEILRLHPALEAFRAGLLLLEDKAEELMAA